MRLKILLPTEVFLDEAVTKVSAEAENGAFGLLPHHIDFVTSLVPGILMFDLETGNTQYVAVDSGILVKRADEVLVSVRQAVRSDDLETLQQTVEDQFLILDDRQKQTQTALAHLEAGFVRGMMETR
jgi:F-type H+-transporting ATPase subunit epsilon